jgi:hypothetical protein
VARRRNVEGPAEVQPRRAGDRGRRRAVFQLLFVERGERCFELDGVLFELEPRRGTDAPTVGGALHLSLRRLEDEFLTDLVGSALARWAEACEMVEVELHDRNVVTCATLSVGDVRVRLDVEQLLAPS